MIIKASKIEREFLEQELLELIKENESDLSHASDDEIRSGISTFHDDFSINQALMKRAIEHIRNTVIDRRITDRNESYYLMNEGNRWLAEQEEKDRMDSIGPELLGIDMDDDIPF